MKIIKSKYEGKSYNILRFDKLVGGLYSIVTEVFYKSHAHKSNTFGIFFDGSYANILADIYSILKLGKILYIFTLFKSEQLQKIVNLLKNDKIHYVSLMPTVTVNLTEDAYNNMLITKIHEYITNNPTILFLSSIYNVEKINILQQKLPKYLPKALLTEAAVIWTINNPRDFLAIILKNINHNLIVNEINMNRIHDKTMYAIKDSIYKPFKNDIIIPKYSMNEYNEKKYFYVLKKYGQTGDYVFNYIGDIDKQVIAIRRALKRSAVGKK